MTQPVPFALTDLRQLLAHGFDDIIDVRAPTEFADDHLPGAISLPVLDDVERARVGTIYKQQSPFLARKVGGALVARNVAAHLEGPLADRDGGWRPLVYCWRGGQRSGSMAVILAAVGWRVAVVQGGYKTWRSLVVRALHDTPVPSPLIVLDGQTGTAKTALLARMAARGVQVIDLEGLANHRGSLFGGMPGGQPTQRGFEGQLAMALAALDPARPVVVEAESSKVGNLALPPMLWKAMLTAPRLAVTAPVPARAAYLTRAYADLVADAARLDAVVASLRPLHPAEVIAHWRGLVHDGDVVALAADLMTRHYDQRYERSRARSADRIVATFEVDGLEDAGLDRLADRLTSAVRAL